MINFQNVLRLVNKDSECQRYLHDRVTHAGEELHENLKDGEPEAQVSAYVNQ